MLQICYLLYGYQKGDMKCDFLKMKKFAKKICNTDNEKSVNSGRYKLTILKKLQIDKHKNCIYRTRTAIQHD